MVANVGNPAAAASAYATTAKTLVSSAGTETGTAPAGGVAFGDMLEQTARSAIQTIHGGEKASALAVAGKMDPLAVTQAVTAARVTLDTVVAVRDQAIDAYNKIIQMPI